MAGIEYPKTPNKPSLGRRALRGSGRATSFVFRLVMKLLLVVLFIAGGLLIGGFLQFASSVSDSQLPPAADVPQVDPIVVLTGGSTRIEKALELLALKKANKLLISGVNADTLKSDIEAMHTDMADLFDCCVEVEKVAEDTIGNAVESAKWMRANGYDSLILVTSAYHMPRSLLEFKRQAQDLEISPYPVPLESINDAEWWKNSGTLRFMMNEYLKYLGARSRDYLKPQTLESIRGSMFGESA